MLFIAFVCRRKERLDNNCQDCQQRIKGAGVHDRRTIVFRGHWHEEAFLSKEVLWEFRRVETQGRRDADGEGHETVSEMKLKFAMERPGQALYRVGVS